MYVPEHFGDNDVPDGAGAAMRHRQERTATRQEGQVIVLFALGIVAILALASLAIDVSGAYVAERFQKTVADSISLAGAQDLFDPTSRAVNSTQQQRALKNAMKGLAIELNVAVPACPQVAFGSGTGAGFKIVNCTLGTGQYHVWLTTPSPTCVSCDPRRSVQVTLGRPSFDVTFGHLFGQKTWNIAATSVSGTASGIRYALVVLRPQTPRNGCSVSGNQLHDVEVQGDNTTLRIVNGDIGSNTSVYSNSNTGGALVILDTGFHIYHLCPTEEWNGGADGVVLPPPVLVDPNYVTTTAFNAMFTYLQTTPPYPFANQAAGQTTCPVPSSTVNPPAGALCFNPGYYPSGSCGGTCAFTVQSSDTAYLLPGVYAFGGDVVVKGKLIAGNVSGQPGVSLLFKKDDGSGHSYVFANASALQVSLNMGDSSCAQDSCRATPVGVPTFPLLQTQTHVPITIVVEKYLGCFDPGTTSPTFPCTDTGNDTKNKLINLSGGGQLDIAGIVYAPTDQVQISGKSGTNSTLGQIVAWTVTYSGGATLNQSFPGLFFSGIVRIDAACTKGQPVTPCNAP
jgi:hypothetical protein